MLIETERFGTLEVDDTTLINFRHGLPGFSESRRFILVHDDASDPIEWLQCVDPGGPVLPVLRTFSVLADYDIEIPDAELSDIEATDVQDLLVLNVVVIPDSIENMTANLIAPIVINVSNGAAKQVIIDTKKYSVRQPIFKAIMAYMEGGAA